MTVILSLLTLLALGGPGPGKAGLSKSAPTDSIGVEMRGGQRFVKHRVTAGETLTALTRRYRVTLDQLTAANPQIKNGLGIGQIVFVPRPAGGKAAAAPAIGKAPPAGPAPANGAAPARYTVAKGETLFGIARRFQLTPDDLIKLNKLPASGAVRVGQQLLLTAAEAGVPAAATAAPKAVPVVARPAETEAAAAPAVKTPAAPSPDKPAEIATVTPAPPAEKEKAEEPASEDRPAPSRASEVLARVVESGLGASIERSVTDKYLALHKTAPVGTIMQVKNSMNGLSVYVRVIGKLPNTGENNNILVRLSPRAVQKLGTADARFRVETNYVP